MTQARAIDQRLIYVVFLLSGMAALIYQLAWQRALFTIYGSDSASITAIVTAFMLGLGLGSLAGGAISKRTERSLITLFAALEGAIGLFGLLSLPLARWLGELTAGISALAAGSLTFVIFLLPTGLMGATLPILVTYLVGRDVSVGETVGHLYGVNTMGSAAVCFLATALLFEYLGLQGSVWLACAINVAVASSALLALRRAPAQEAT